MPKRRKSPNQEWVQSVREAVPDIILARSLVWGFLGDEDQDELLLLRRIETRLSHDPNPQQYTEPSKDKVNRAVRDFAASLYQLKTIFEATLEGSKEKFRIKDLEHHHQKLGRALAELLYEWLMQREEAEKAEKSKRDIKEKFTKQTKVRYGEFKERLEDWQTVHQQVNETVVLPSSASSPAVPHTLDNTTDSRASSYSFESQPVQALSEGDNDGETTLSTDSLPEKVQEDFGCDESVAEEILSSHDLSTWVPGLGISSWNSKWRQDKRQ